MRSLIPQRRASYIRIRRELCDWLHDRGLSYIEPQANFVMIETGRDAADVQSAMLEKGVAIGRRFPPLTTMIRVTIGTDTEMAKFRKVFTEVMA